MFSNKLETWIGLVGLSVALTGCPGDDTGSDTNNTTTPMTSGMNTTGEEETTGGPEQTTGEPPATDDATTGEPPDDTTGGPVTCDPPCAANEECIEGVCFPTGECDPPCAAGEECVDGVCEMPTPTNSDYGPCDACAPGEMPVQVTGAEGCFCSPGCDGMGSMCPEPNDGTAQGQCVLETMAGAGPNQCALICDPAMEMCPAGATCQEVQPMIGICTHPA